MNSRSFRLSLPAVAWAAAPFVCWVVACGGGEFTSGGDAGTSGGDASVDQGQTGHGGSTAAGGGAAGSGGVTSKGGAAGTGGVEKEGGAPDSGGASGDGGAPGSGGVMSNGGAPGSGGVMSNGGAPGAGGAVQTVQCYCPSDSPSCGWLAKCEGTCGSKTYARAACDCTSVCEAHSEDECNKDTGRCTWSIYSKTCTTINCSDTPQCPDGCTQKAGYCNANVESVSWQQPTDPSQCPH